MEPHSWSRSFPRLYELFLASQQTNPKNWFGDRSTQNAIEDPPHPFIVQLEKDFQSLNATAWRNFVDRATPYVCITDQWGWWTQLFECFNELKAYLFFKQEGYADIRFIKPKGQKRTPDLCGQRDSWWAWLEVKTLHETHDMNAYMTGKGKYEGKEKEARKVGPRLTDNMKQRLTNTIEEAREQLEYDHHNLPHPVTRKIIFLLVWFDSPYVKGHDAEDLQQFLNNARPEGIEIVHQIMNHIIP